MSALTAILFVGLGVGLVVSLGIWPADCSGVGPADLGQADRHLWVAAAARAYERESDLRLAGERLSLAGDDAAMVLCRVAAGECSACDYADGRAALALTQAVGLYCTAGN